MGIRYDVTRDRRQSKQLAPLVGNSPGSVVLVLLYSRTVNELNAVNNALDGAVSGKNS